MNKYLLLFAVFVTLSVVIIFRENKTNMKGKINDSFFKKSEEQNLNFLWSKGLEKKNEYMLEKTDNTVGGDIISKQLKNEIVWIRLGSMEKEKNCDLDVFSNLLDQINHKIILVTSDGDKSIPSDLKKETFEKIINHKKIKNWYTQNYDGSYSGEKLKHYPIGFDLHTERTFFGVMLPFLPKKSVTEKINTLLYLRKKYKNKKDKIFCDVHLSCNEKFNNERKKVKDILEKEKHLEFLKLRTNQNNIWEKYANHKFTISTHGNGLDCHRTWEIMFLGSIVITKTSSLDKMFEGLPVIIVDDWDECKSIENLKIWDKIYSPLTKSENINKYFLYETWIK